jgi:hypothetical protein
VNLSDLGNFTYFLADITSYNQSSANRPAARDLPPSVRDRETITTAELRERQGLPPTSRLAAGEQPKSILRRRKLTTAELREKQRVQQTLYNVGRLGRPKHDKPISECDAEEWPPRVGEFMRGVPPSVPAESTAVTWDENSKAMFLIRTDVSKFNGILKQTNFQ